MLSRLPCHLSVHIFDKGDDIRRVCDLQLVKLSMCKNIDVKTMVFSNGKKEIAARKVFANLNFLP